jgi:endonuclease-8
MPEGDSYARAAAKLRPALLGKTITSVDGGPNVRRWSDRLIGHEVAAIRTHGKHLFIDVVGDVTIHVWMGMPGRWRISDRTGAATFEGERTRTRQDPGAIRLLIETDTHRAVCLSAPTVEVERRRVIDRVVRRLGPDVLDDTFDMQSFLQRARLLDPAASVADMLLDQRVLAGVGNEYKNEILFLEGLHPTRLVADVDDDVLSALAARASRLMKPNATRAGSRVTTGYNRRGMQAWVYERSGEPCRRCHTDIEVTHMGRPNPRITYWCPKCQPEM